jgi:iron(III) transport system ATP-binding protein
VLGDPTLPPKAGDEVTVSIRPECWVIGREQKAQNCIEGVIGNAVYLGEMARYDFVCAGMTLKIVELNPRFIGPMAEGKLQASVDPEDAVVLVE